MSKMSRILFFPDLLASLSESRNNFFLGLPQSQAAYFVYLGADSFVEDLTCMDRDVDRFISVGLSMLCYRDLVSR